MAKISRTAISLYQPGASIDDETVIAREDGGGAVKRVTWRGKSIVQVLGHGYILMIMNGWVDLRFVYIGSSETWDMLIFR